MGEEGAQIQSYANINDTKSFYEALKAVYGPRHFSLHPVRSIDGDLIKNKELILERWAEYLQNLLNKVHTTDPGFLDDLPTLPIIPKLDDPPSFDEVERAIRRLKDNIPPEVIKYGGCALHRRLHNFILDCWSAKCLPQQWKNANIILVHKQKGDRAECGNSRGISLLSVASKVLAKIMLTRLLEHVVDLILPESQCGFRRGRSTIDMIFVARQLQEKCREQHQDLYLAFVDLTKAFDTVNRDLLWNILRKFGCPPTFIAILQQFHTGMCAQVVMAGSQSSSFPVEAGVKQSCVLAPSIFNLLLVAITLVSHRDLQSSDCVGIEYRLDGGLFNLRRLQAKTKTSSAMISALQYADDAAFPSHTADGLQRSLDVMSETYLRAGLIINTTKTEILSTPSPGAPTFAISGNQLKNCENFTYLGSNLSFSGDLTNEIQRRINLASSAFGRLSKRVFGNKNLMIHTKIVVYNAVVISTILYGCKTWVPYRRHIRILESFHIRRLQLILGLRWWHKVTHSEIRSRAGIPSIEAMLLHRQLRWLGHVIRMPHNRLPHRLLYGQLQLGRRSVGGQNKRFEGHIKSILKRCNIPISRLETLASERTTRRSTCALGLSYFDDEYDRAAALSRRHQHAPVLCPIPDSVYQCPLCGRQCFLRIDLLSHSKTHFQR